MKNLSFICCIALLLSVYSLQAQQPSSCDAPPMVEWYYQHDASQLAIRSMLNNPDLVNEVKIPDQLFQNYLDALLAVFNVEEIPERDIVIECLNVHTFPIPNPTTIDLGADTSFQWVQTLASAGLPSGNEEIDELFSSYNLYVNSANQIGANLWFSISSYQYLNTTALASLFAEISGVNWAEPSGIFGGGADITSAQGDPYVDLTYSYGWGDCQAGCIFNRYWRFRVFQEDCSVELLSVWGDELVEDACYVFPECHEDPLSYTWVQDITNNPDCWECEYLSKATWNGYPIIIHRWEAANCGITDSGFHRIYNCNGALLQSCQITIAGFNCDLSMGIQLQDIENEEVIWSCLLDATKDASLGSDFLIYPNPAGEELIFETKLPGSSNSKIEIYTLDGTKVREFIFSDKQCSLATDSMLPGLYLCKWYSGQTVLVRKFVIK